MFDKIYKHIVYNIQCLKKLFIDKKNIFMMFNRMYKLCTYIVNVQAITTQLHRYIVYILLMKKYIYEA
jgi:hypothetical protein